MEFDFDKLKKQGEYLFIQLDDWFTGIDGQDYKSIWGKCKIHRAKDMFGFRPTGDANWYLQVGEKENAVFVAGCRIHYAQLSLNKPKNKNTLIIN